jgi:hypothetical protein
MEMFKDADPKKVAKILDTTKGVENDAVDQVMDYLFQEKKKKEKPEKKGSSSDSDEYYYY